MTFVYPVLQFHSTFACVFGKLPKFCAMVPESSPALPKVSFQVQLRVPLKPSVHGQALVAGRTIAFPSGLVVGIVIV